MAALQVTQDLLKPGELPSPIFHPGQLNNFENALKLDDFCIPGSVQGSKKYPKSLVDIPKPSLWFRVYYPVLYCWLFLYSLCLILHFYNLVMLWTPSQLSFLRKKSLSINVNI